jgi:hypothetical protein
MWLRALLLGGLFAGLLSACAVVDPVDSRYDTVTRSLAKARDESIFLNLVRASHDYPLAFTTIANVTPTMTNTSSFALPSFSLGPPNCLPTALPAMTRSCSFPTGIPGNSVGIGNSTASNATAVSTNFNVSTEETGSFYQGFLRPIELETLNYFIRQDYPRELLFWLFADSFQFQLGASPQAAVGYQYSPPGSYGCPREKLPGLKQLCFKDWVLVALLSGLTVEEKAIIKPESAGGGGKGDSPSGGGAKGPQTTTVDRFCFSTYLQHQAMLQLGIQDMATVKKLLPFDPSLIKPNQYCGNWSPADATAQASAPQEDIFKLAIGPYTFRIVPRSAYGVFNFLGNLMKMQREGLPPSPNAFIPPTEDASVVTEMPPTLVTEDHHAILVVLQNDYSGRCFAHTWFYDGDYCVPESATTTKEIFSLLAQLIAIETTATDLSITPIVRVIQ